MLSPVVLSKDGPAPRLAFVDYYKGNYSLHTFDLKEPLHTAASADFGTPGPIVDFQAPLQHTLVAENKTKKGRFEKMFLDGRPPVNIGVTQRRRRVRRIDGVVHRRARRSAVQHVCVLGAAVQDDVVLVLESVAPLPVGRSGLFADAVLLRPAGATLFYDPAIAPFIRREDALATQTVRGGSIFGIYPFSTYRRVEFSGGLVDFREEYADPGLQFEADRYQQDNFGTTLFNKGLMMPLGVSFIQETTVFREYGPLSGSTMRLSYEGAPKVGNMLSRQTADADARYYMRLGANGVFAVRAYGFRSWGDAPGYTFFGGNSEMRGYEYREFLGHKGFYTNAELRFPLINAMATPIGILGGIRGVFFANIGGAGLNTQPFKIWDDKPRQIIPPVTADERADHQTGPTDRRIPARRFARVVWHRPRDLRARVSRCTSTGRTGRCSTSRGKTCSMQARRKASAGFRKARFTAWIGYDF